MKILVVTTGFPYFENENLAHACKFVYYECLAYEKAGAEVEVVAPGIPGVPQEDVVGENINVHRFNYFFPKKWQTVRRADGLALYSKMNVWFFIQIPFFLLSFCWAIIKYGRKADILHCSWTLTALLAFPLRWLFRKPITLTIRGSDIRIIPRWINRFVCKNVDANLFAYAHIPFCKKQVKDYPGKYFLDIPLIVPSTENKKDRSKIEKSKGAFLIVFIGRFDSYKLNLGLGFFTLLNAISILSSKYPQIHCIYVGDGEFREKLVQSAIDLQIEKNVQFDGYKKDVYSYIQAADLVVGGIGIDTITQESSINKKPQLMPKIKDWYEGLWQDKENALLYEPQDTESMAEAIRYAVENEKYLKKIGDNAYKTVSSFIKGIEESGTYYIKAFQKVLKNDY